MRVISGIYKRTNLEGFDIEGTRPTMDRVKESMFAMIQSYIKETNVLDLFAGSGALGIEALSNGASNVTLVDSNNIAINAINKNLSKIHNPSNVKVIKSDFKAFLKNTKEKYDLILLDPPYGKDLVNGAITLIKEFNLLSDDGIIVCELENEEFDGESFEVIKYKKIKNKEIIILK